MVRLRVVSSHPVMLANIRLNAHTAHTHIYVHTGTSHTHIILTHTHSLDTDPDRTRLGYTLITCLKLDIISASRLTMETMMEGQVRDVCVLVCECVWFLHALYVRECLWMSLCAHIFMFLVLGVKKGKHQSDKTKKVKKY